MHHAYLYRGETPFSLGDWPDLFSRETGQSRRHFDSIGIAEVRAIIREVLLTAPGTDNHILILETDNITHEAEQAMLKVFEEPRSGIALVLCLPPGYELLATLRSRFYELLVPASNSINQDFLDFINLSYAERLTNVADRLNKKDNQWLNNLKRGLVAWLRQNRPGEPLSVYELVVSRLGERGASNKMLLELLALTLSSVKK